MRVARLIQRRGRAFWRTFGARRLRRQSQGCAGCHAGCSGRTGPVRVSVERLGGTAGGRAAGPSPSGVAATLLAPAQLDRAGAFRPNRKGPWLRTAGKPTRPGEETSMASPAPTTLGRRLRLAAAGAAVVTALSVATAGAAASAPMGVQAAGPAGLARLGAARGSSSRVSAPTPGVLMERGRGPALGRQQTPPAASSTARAATGRWTPSPVPPRSAPSPASPMPPSTRPISRSTTAARPPASTATPCPAPAAYRPARRTGS